MRKQARTIRVLACLVASVTAGAFILMLLEGNSLSEGPFCLTSYTNLNSVEDATSGPIIKEQQRWDSVEVFYSSTIKGGIDSLATLNQLVNSEDANFHFTICNGMCDEDGFIQATVRWKKQRPCLPDDSWSGSDRVIRICVLSDPKAARLTDCQVKRTITLVELLSRKFSIYPENIRYPVNWQL